MPWILIAFNTRVLDKALQMKVVHPNKEGGVSVLTPTRELPIEEVARKDVPYNTPYRIVSEAEMPTDRTFRNAWEADFSAPDGYGIGPQRWFIERAEKEIATLKNNAATDDPAAQKIRAERIAFNEALIQQMKDEVFIIEGVQL